DGKQHRPHRLTLPLGISRPLHPLFGYRGTRHSPVNLRIGTSEAPGCQRPEALFPVGRFSFLLSAGRRKRIPLTAFGPFSGKIGGTSCRPDANADPMGLPPAGGIRIPLAK